MLSLSHSDDATFVFFCVETSACFELGSAQMQERMGQQRCGGECSQHGRSGHGHTLLWDALGSVSLGQQVGALLPSSPGTMQNGASELPPDAVTDLNLRLVLLDAEALCSGHLHS